jgi:two-component system, OmpR family, sensor histidine kinase VicK
VRQRKDGTYVDISLTVSPVLDNSGRVIGASKIARDIGERKAAEEATRQAMMIKDQFLGLVSHELRTPIATILGNGQLLLSRGDRLEEEDKRQALNDVVTEGERLQRIIENLLLLSRLDAGKGLEVEPLLLSHLTREAVQSFERRHPGRAITLTTGDRLPAVVGSPTLVSLVLDNLIANADKYSNAETPIQIHVTGDEAAGDVQVAVKDRGIGFTSGEATQLFTAFFRTRAASDRAPGMGLGLAVCKKVIEAQGGTISAEAREGGGSVFRFSLPAA